MTTPSEHGSNGLNELDRCTTCSHNRLWHDKNRPMHQFNDGNVSFRDQFGRTSRERREDPAPRPASPPPAYPIDPVLRQALVDKGIITAEDLDQARTKIEDMTRMFGGTP